MTNELAAHKSAGKPLVGDLDPDFILGMAEVLAANIEKYPNDPDGMPNWWKGGDYRSFLASMGRHWLAMARGDDLDLGEQGDGLHHALHLAVDAMFYYSWQRRGVGKDTRLVD